MLRGPGRLGAVVRGGGRWRRARARGVGGSGSLPGGCVRVDGRRRGGTLCDSEGACVRWSEAVTGGGGVNI